jgi:O-antigen/teichoic acid export membrane protein
VKTSLLKNGLYNTIGGVLRIGLGIVTVPLLIRQLGIEEYGLWTLASAVISVVALAEAGLSTATTVFVAQDLGDKDVNGLSQTLTVTITMMLLVATLAASTLWFGSDSITHLFPQLSLLQKIDVSKAFQFGALVVWSRLVQQVLVGIEQAYQRYDLVNLIGTIQSLLTNVGMLSILWLGGKTLELMQWQAVTSMLILLSHSWIIKSLLQKTPIRMMWVKEKALKVGKYSFMVWLSSLGTILFSRVDRLIVGSILGTQSLGVYSAITDVTSQINVMSALPIHPLVPLLGKLIADKDTHHSELQRQIQHSFRTNSLVAIGLGAGLITLAPACLDFLFAGNWDGDNLSVFSICCAIYAIYSTNAVGYYMLIGIKEINMCTLIVSVSGGVSILLILLGAYNFGLAGAIYGNAGYLLTLMLSAVAMRKVNLPLIILKESLSFPVLFLLLVFIGSYYLDISILTRGIVTVFQTVIIMIWYFKKNTLMGSKPPTYS